MLLKRIKKIGAVMKYRLRHSPWFSFYTGHQRVLFPCCSLSEGDPNLSWRLFADLHQKDHDLGLWQDCCGMPLVYAKAKAEAERAKADLLHKVKAQDIREIITPCTTCYRRFSDIFTGAANPPKVTILYDYLEPHIPAGIYAKETFVTHHPCPARGNRKLQESYERLADKMGLRRSDQSQGHPLACCLSTTPQSTTRIKQQQGNNILTYCAHCVQRFQRRLRTTHILQLLYPNGKSLRSHPFVSRLLNLLRLKKKALHHFKKRTAP